MSDIFDKAEHERLRTACLEVGMEPGSLKFKWTAEGDFRDDKSFYGSGEISMTYSLKGKSKRYVISHFKSQHMDEIEADIRSNYYLA